jgi:hypothetical protein
VKGPRRHAQRDAASVQARDRARPIAAYLTALALSTTACTRTVTRTHYVRVPCLPSEAPPIPVAEYDTAEWEAEYVALLGAVAYVWRACAVEPRINSAPTDTGLIHAGSHGD